MGKTYTNRDKKKRHKQDFSQSRKRKASRFEDEVSKTRTNRSQNEPR